MTYNIISTGSKGNAVVLDGGILVDCGVPFKKLKHVMYDIKLVLLTHIHSDHFNRSTIKRLASERPTLRFACCEWLVSELAALVDKRQIDVAEPATMLSYGDFCSVMPTRLVHDVPNVGWHIYIGKEKAFYATDTGTLDGVNASGYNLYFIEANHTIEDIELRTKEKQERGEYAYELRAAANHLSEEQALDWILNNSGSNSEFVLLHQHDSINEQA